MKLWAILLLLAPIGGHSETIPQPFISLEPKWTVNFEGESVTLTCNVVPFYSPWKTTWYHEQFYKTVKKIRGRILQVKESGDYRCQVTGSALSSSVHLDFSKASLILQAPPAVFEGDLVILRCKSRAEAAATAKAINKNRKHLEFLGESSEFRIRNAGLKDNGDYHCTELRKECCNASSNTVKIQVQELFPRPVLTASSRRPVEGNPLTLTCETQLPPQKSSVQLQFRFFKEKQTLGSGWQRSTELQIPAVWEEDSGSYSCEAMGSSIEKSSPTFSVQVQRAAVKVQVHTVPASESVLEGQELVFICSVEGIRGPITVSWYKISNRKKTKIQASPAAEFKILEVKSSDAGMYTCEANNSHYHYEANRPVTITVKVPVSQPELTLRTRRDLVAEGDTVTLYCKVWKGSFPIVYQFYREDVFLKKITLSWKVSFVSISLTAEHSGNYYCTADNGLGPQRSEAVSLTVTVPISQPVLTISTARAQIVEGDSVTLRCATRRGSPPILYRFYHKDVPLRMKSITSEGLASFNFFATAEHSGNYHCSASNSLGTQYSEPVSLSITVPVSRPVLTLRAPRMQAVVGDVLELHCDASRGSPPILYEFYHEDVLLGSHSAPTGGGASFNLSLSAEHSGNYSCKANNDVATEHSDTMSFTVTVPVSRPVLILRILGAQAVVGDVMELHCETLTGSPPILYQFYHENVTLGSSSTLYGGEASLNLSLTSEHSGNYSCEARNMLGAQHSNTVTLSVTVPVSRPVLTLRVFGAQAVVGDIVELHCEALIGSPPILYRFYHENVILGNLSAPSGGRGASFNFSLTSEHSGNYSCEADNQVETKCSEVVTLSISGLTENRSSPVATAVTGALFMVGLAAGALLLYCWLSKKAEGEPSSNSSRSPSDSDPQEPTYHNVPAWIELQPVYSNVNPRGRDVVYSEVKRIRGEAKLTAPPAPTLLRNKDCSVVYSQVKVASTPASRAQLLTASAPHR
ncbi:Fc receptor-like protein 5 [Ochotona princeps]|uniref:Fc receptor-like protein 5 n=1 Tax=Ochotona princeps TaxID=9978 RepID=UPI0027153155|nr:Fc receptor-like protein 5 [Ochotona princeps]